MINDFAPFIIGGLLIGAIPVLIEYVVNGIYPTTEQAVYIAVLMLIAAVWILYKGFTRR